MPSHARQGPSRKSSGGAWLRSTRCGARDAVGATAALRDELKPRQIRRRCVLSMRLQNRNSHDFRGCRDEEGGGDDPRLADCATHSSPQEEPDASFPGNRHRVGVGKQCCFGLRTGAGAGGADGIGNNHAVATHCASAALPRGSHAACRADDVRWQSQYRTGRVVGDRQHRAAGRSAAFLQQPIVGGEGRCAAGPGQRR
ncbi:hypothetical protein D3C81_1146230 [compost metagenome]